MVDDIIIIPTIMRSRRWFSQAMKNMPSGTLRFVMHSFPDKMKKALGIKVPAKEGAAIRLLWRSLSWPHHIDIFRFIRGKNYDSTQKINLFF